MAAAQCRRAHAGIGILAGPGPGPPDAGPTGASGPFNRNASGGAHGNRARCAARRQRATTVPVGHITFGDDNARAGRRGGVCQCADTTILLNLKPETPQRATNLGHSEQ